MCDFRCFFGGYLNKIAAHLQVDKRLVVWINPWLRTHVLRYTRNRWVRRMIERKQCRLGFYLLRHKLWGPSQILLRLDCRGQPMQTRQRQYFRLSWESLLLVFHSYLKTWSCCRGLRFHYSLSKLSWSFKASSSVQSAFSYMASPAPELKSI